MKKIALKFATTHSQLVTLLDEWVSGAKQLKDMEVLHGEIIENSQEVLNAYDSLMKLDKFASDMYKNYRNIESEFKDIEHDFSNLAVQDRREDERYKNRSPWQIENDNIKKRERERQEKILRNKTGGSSKEWREPPPAIPPSRY